MSSPPSALGSDASGAAGPVAAEVAAEPKTTTPVASAAPNTIPSDPLWPKAMAPDGTLADFTEEMEFLFSWQPSHVWPLVHGRIICWIRNRPFTMARNNETMVDIANEFGLDPEDMNLINIPMYGPVQENQGLKNGTLLAVPWMRPS